MENLRVLITGVNGFVGSNIYHSLKNIESLIGIYNSGKAKFENCYQLNLSDENSVQKFISKEVKLSIDVIIHTASKMASSDNALDISILNENTAITKSVAVLAKHFKVKHIINFSSSSIYPNVDGLFNEESIVNPSLNSDCLYGLSKFNSEIILDYLLHNSGIKVTHLRTTMIYGIGMNKSRIIPSLEKEIEEKNTVTVFGGGERVLNLISIETIIRHVTFFIKNPYIGKLNIGEETISILDLAKRIAIQKGNQHTQIIVKENGNRNKFILDISLLKKITIDA